MSSKSFNIVIKRKISPFVKTIKVDSTIIRYLTVKYNKLDLKNEYFGEKKNTDEKKQKKTK